MNRFRIWYRFDHWRSTQHKLGLLRFRILMADFRTEKRPRDKPSARQRNRTAGKLLAMIVNSRRRFHTMVVGRGERLECEGRRLGGLGGWLCGEWGEGCWG